MLENEKVLAATGVDSDSLLTSHQVGKLLQVNPSSINKWVKDGLIRAFRTPGGHRRIRAADLVVFLNKHEMPIPRSLSGAVKKRLLIVDDDPRQLLAVGRMFKPYGERVEVQIVDNGIDALVQLGSFKPHMAILDVMMNPIDGFEVLRRLRAKDETRDLTVIMTTDQMSPETEAKAKKAGALRCVQKPVDYKVVLDDLGIPSLMLGEITP
jgi:excisionase family DNA binding protein